MYVLRLASPSRTSLGLQRSEQKLLQRGKEFRGVGVNHFSLFVRELFDFSASGAPNTGLENDLQRISGLGIPFIRVCFGWWDYTRWRDLYAINNAAYWATADRVIKACERYGVGVIADMFWDWRGFTELSHYYGAFESVEQSSQPTSATWARMTAHMQQFVQRYAESPAIWAWEFANEACSNAGPEFGAAWALDGTFAPWLNWGLRPDGVTARTANEKLSMLGYRRIQRQFRNIVKANDPHNRIILAGNASGNSFAVRVWTTGGLDASRLTDYSGVALTEYRPYLEWINQSSDVLSTHLYPGAARVGDGIYYADGDRTLTQHYADLAGWAAGAKKPLCVTEFGATYRGDPVDSVSVDEATERANFFEAVAAITNNNIPLTACWNYGGNIFSTLNWMKWDITHPTRQYQLDAVVGMNSAMRIA